MEPTVSQGAYEEDDKQHDLEMRSVVNPGLLSPGRCEAA
jgi:hypothetical protein